MHVTKNNPLQLLHKKPPPEKYSHFEYSPGGVFYFILRMKGLSLIYEDLQHAFYLSLLQAHH